MRPAGRRVCQNTKASTFGQDVGEAMYQCCSASMLAEASWRKLTEERLIANIEATRSIQGEAAVTTITEKIKCRSKRC